MVALVTQDRISIVSSIYKEALGMDRQKNAEKFLSLYDEYRLKLPEGAKSRDFVRLCVIFSFEISDLAWHGRCNASDPNWISPLKMLNIGTALLNAGFYLESDPPRIARESILD